MRNELRSARTACGALLWTANLAVALPLPAAQADAGAGERARPAVVAVLHGAELEDRGAWRAAEERLLALGAEALPAVLELLVAGELRGAIGSDTSRLSPEARELLRSVLIRTPSAELRAFLSERFTTTAPSPEEGLVALDVLSTVGDARDLRLVAWLVGRVDPEQRASLGSAPTVAFVEILRRDIGGFGRTAGIMKDVDGDVAERLLDALVETEVPRALDVLSAVLHDRSVPPITVLPRMAKLAERSAPPFEEDVLGEVRARLTAEDAAEQREAAHAAAALQDYAAIPALIDLLESPAPATLRAAHSALRRIAQLPFGSDPRRWRSWHSAELHWWEHRAPEVLERLQSGTAPEIVQALGEVVTRRLRRDELAAEVVMLLEHDDATVRRLACAGLSQMASVQALPALVLALEDFDEGVREAAALALRALTGRDLDPEPEVWQKALEDEEKP